MKDTNKGQPKSGGRQNKLHTTSATTEHVPERLNQADEELGALERRYRQLIEQAADGIFIITPDGKFILANAKTCAMLGYAEQELLQ
jgi:PAS domain-containing protein